MLQSNDNNVVQIPPQETVNNLINLCKQGQFKKVFEHTQILLKQTPKVYMFWNIMGVSASQLEMHDIAIQAYNNAITLNSDFSEAYFNMGITFTKQGKFDEAINAYRKTVSLNPNHIDAYNNMSNIYLQHGKLNEAIEGLKKALSIRPTFAEAHNNLGLIYLRQEKIKQALEAFQKTISLNPKHAAAHNNMGCILRDTGKFNEAEEIFKKSVSLKPNYAQAYNNLGICYQFQDKLDEAIETYNTCILLKPDYAYALNNLAGCYKNKGNFEEALNTYEKALLKKPDYPEAYYNSSFIYNLKGDLRKGLELYEWRLKKKNPKARLPRNHLIWDGIESIKGKKFFVYEEQGLGDVIQFCRYLLLLKQKGAEVTFKVQRKMHALLQTMDSNIILVENDPDDKEIDFEAPLMSLMYLFNTNLKTIPSSKSYLFANQDKVISWWKSLNKTAFKIGICWQGNTLQSEVGRSFPLSLFEDISKLQNVELISLHKGEGEKQIKDIKFDLTTFNHDFDDGESSFIDTASVMVNCDLIISCDTSIAHLAGALGCPIWVALKKIPEWRWMLDRTDSPWYPNMRLYRQKELGEWKPVFETMKKDLAKLIKQKIK